MYLPSSLSTQKDEVDTDADSLRPGTIAPCRRDHRWIHHGRQSSITGNGVSLSHRQYSTMPDNHHKSRIDCRFGHGCTRGWTRKLWFSNSSIRGGTLVICSITKFLEYQGFSTGKCRSNYTRRGKRTNDNEW